MNFNDVISQCDYVVKYYARRYVRSLPHMELSDVYQCMLLRVWRDLPRYDAAQASIQTFVAQAANSAGFLLLRDSRAAMRTGTTVELRDSDSEGADAEVDPMLRAGLTRALQALPQAQQRVVSVLYGQGLGETSAARNLGIPRQTLIYRHKKILSTLQKKLTQSAVAL